MFNLIGKFINELNTRVNVLKSRIFSDEKKQEEIDNRLENWSDDDNFEDIDCRKVEDIEYTDLIIGGDKFETIVKLIIDKSNNADKTDDYSNNSLLLNTIYLGEFIESVFKHFGINLDKESIDGLTTKQIKDHILGNKVTIDKDYIKNISPTYFMCYGYPVYISRLKQSQKVVKSTVEKISKYLNSIDPDSIYKKGQHGGLNFIGKPTYEYAKKYQEIALFVLNRVNRINTILISAKLSILSVKFNQCFKICMMIFAKMRKEKNK